MFVADVVVIEFQQRVAQLVRRQVREHVVKQVQGFVGKQGVGGEGESFAGHSLEFGGDHRVSVWVATKVRARAESCKSNLKGS